MTRRLLIVACGLLSLAMGLADQRSTRAVQNQADLYQEFDRYYPVREVRFDRLGHCVHKRDTRDRNNVTTLARVALAPDFMAAELAADPDALNMIAGPVVDLIELARHQEVSMADATQVFDRVETRMNSLLGEDACKNLLLLEQAGRFYRLGPEAYFRQAGATDNDIAIIKARMAEFAPLLERKVRRIEAEHTRQLFAVLGERRATQLQEIIESTMAQRQGAICMFQYSLDIFAENDYQPLDYVGFFPVFLIRDFPVLEIDEFIRRDRLADRLETLKLFMRDPQVANVYQGGFVRRANMLSQYQSDKNDIQIRLHNNPELGLRDKLYAELDARYAKIEEDQIKTLDKYLQQDETGQVGQTQFLYLYSRIGPACLTTDEVQSLLGISVTEEDFLAMKAAVPEVQASLRKDCTRLQKVALDYLFLTNELPAELESHIRWTRAHWIRAVPPVDILTELFRE